MGYSCTSSKNASNSSGSDLKTFLISLTDVFSEKLLLTSIGSFVLFINLTTSTLPLKAMFK